MLLRERQCDPCILSLVEDESRIGLAEKAEKPKRMMGWSSTSRTLAGVALVPLNIRSPSRWSRAQALRLY